MKTVNKAKYLFLKSKDNYNRIKNDLIKITDEEYNNYFSNIIFGTFNNYNQFIKYTNDSLENCNFYFEDDTNEIIENFKTFSYTELCSFNEHSIAPYNAEKIGVYLNNNRLGDINLGHLKVDFDKRLYRIGLMSDIHYNDFTTDSETGTITYDGSEYENDFPNALTFYQNKEDVNFICASGDISTDNIINVLNFKKSLDQYSPDTEFYSCFGNHDFAAALNSVDNNEIGYNINGKSSLEIWNSILTPNELNNDLHYQDPSTEFGKSSYWFEVPIKDTNKSDIYVFLSVNYASENRKNIIDELTWEKINTSDIIIDSSKNNYDDTQEVLKSSEEFNVVLKYSNVGQRFGFNFGNINNCSKCVKINNYKIIDADDNDITYLININNPKIGIYGTDEIYHIDGMIYGKTFNFNDNDLIEMPISSSFSSIYNVSFPITLYMDIEAGIVDEDYQIDELHRSASADTQLTERSPYMQDIIDYVGYMPSKYNLKFYDNSTLLWLKDLLDEYPNKRFFIFTHQFFPHKAGTNTADNAYYHYGGLGDRWRIQENSAYCLCGIQFEFLNKLNNEYENTIWFTGHSHYKWNWQTVDPNINICNNEYNIWRPDDNDFIEGYQYIKKSGTITEKTGYNVHIPSTSRPLKLSNSYEVAPKDSEGAIMDVYENYVDIRGIIFKNENDNDYENKYYPISQYRIYIPAN